MAQVLFYLGILATLGTLLFPLTAPTRGRAVWGWFSNFLAAGTLSLLISMYYPSWQEPQWFSGSLWLLISWVLLIVGLVVAIRKPRKNNVPVA